MEKYRPENLLKFGFWLGLGFVWEGVGSLVGRLWRLLGFFELFFSFQQLGSPGPKAVLSNVYGGAGSSPPRVPSSASAGSPSIRKSKFPFKKLSKKLMSS